MQVEFDFFFTFFIQTFVSSMNTRVYSKMFIKNHTDIKRILNNY